MQKWDKISEKIQNLADCSLVMSIQEKQLVRNIENIENDFAINNKTGATKS